MKTQPQQHISLELLRLLLCHGSLVEELPLKMGKLRPRRGRHGTVGETHGRDNCLGIFPAPQARQGTPQATLQGPADPLDTEGSFPGVSASHWRAMAVRTATSLQGSANRVLEATGSCLAVLSNLGTRKQRVNVHGSGSSIITKGGHNPYAYQLVSRHTHLYNAPT